MLRTHGLSGPGLQRLARTILKQRLIHTITALGIMPQLLRWDVSQVPSRATRGKHGSRDRLRGGKLGSRDRLRGGNNNNPMLTANP
jgi:hypothetical protein